MVDLLKFTSNKILNGVVILSYNQGYNQFGSVGFFFFLIWPIETEIFGLQSSQPKPIEIAGTQSVSVGFLVGVRFLCLEFGPVGPLVFFFFQFFFLNAIFSMLLLQNRDSAKHMGYHFFKSPTLFAYKLEKINILILIHYFQSPNFIDLDSVLNKTQNTKQREGIKIFKRDSL